LLEPVGRTCAFADNTAISFSEDQCARQDSPTYLEQR
jgi:hypothetical protein